MLTGESSETPAVSVEPPAQASATVPAKPAAISTAAYEDALFEATAATAELAVAESPTDWERIASRWQSALSSLNDIPLSSSDYDQVQAKIAEYERNYEYVIAQKAAIELAAAEAITQAQAAEELIAQQPLEAEAIAQAAPLLAIEEPQGEYVDGTCKMLKASGVGSNFRPGDANYTSARDRDNDGVACES